MASKRIWLKAFLYIYIALIVLGVSLISLRFTRFPRKTLKADKKRFQTQQLSKSPVLNSNTPKLIHEEAQHIKHMPINARTGTLPSKLNQLQTLQMGQKRE